MQPFIELLPLLAFAGAYWVGGLKLAVVTLMASMVTLVAGYWMTGRPISRVLLVSTGLVLVLGALSLTFDDPVFIKWKPTVLNWGLAVAFLGSAYLAERTFAERIFQSVAGSVVRLDRQGWRQLNALWAGFFMLSGVANLYAAYRLPEAVWVLFKTFGLLGLTVVFLAGMFWWLNAKGALVEEAAEAEK
jgi:intracellular septation protein